MGENMPLLDDEARNDVKKRFGEMVEPVTIVFYEKEGQFTNEIKALLNELKELTDKLNVEVYAWNSEEAKRDGIDNGPVMKFKSKFIKGDARFYGAPTGYEFATLLEAILLASKGDFKGPLVDFAPQVDKEVKLEVFVTPTCPYCPTSAFMALKLAFLSEKAKGYVYEAIEFPQISNKYNVSGVPKTVINDGKGEYVGAYPEDAAIMKIKEVL